MIHCCLQADPRIRCGAQAAGSSRSGPVTVVPVEIAGDGWSATPGTTWFATSMALVAVSSEAPSEHPELVVDRVMGRQCA